MGDDREHFIPLPHTLFAFRQQMLPSTPFFYYSVALKLALMSHLSPHPYQKVSPYSGVMQVFWWVIADYLLAQARCDPASPMLASRTLRIFVANGSGVINYFAGGSVTEAMRSTRAFATAANSNALADALAALMSHR